VARFDRSEHKKREPPGAALRYDGRLTTPSACPHIVRLSWLSSVCAAIMRYLFETPSSPVIRLWFDRDCQLVNDSERSLSPKRLTEAQFRARLPFVFYYLMRNYWEGFGF
jgi:hypothetical protein